MEHVDKYIVFNNAHRNFLVEFYSEPEIDPMTLPRYKRQKYLSSLKKETLLKPNQSLDLVKFTGLSYEEIKANEALNKIIRQLVILEVSFMVNVDTSKYDDYQKTMEEAESIIKEIGKEEEETIDKILFSARKGIGCRAAKGKFSKLVKERKEEKEKSKPKKRGRPKKDSSKTKTKSTPKKRGRKKKDASKES